MIKTINSKKLQITHNSYIIIHISIQYILLFIFFYSNKKKIFTN